MAKCEICKGRLVKTRELVNLSGHRNIPSIPHEKYWYKCKKCNETYIKTGLKNG